MPGDDLFTEGGNVGGPTKEEYDKRFPEQGQSAVDRELQRRAWEQEYGAASIGTGAYMGANRQVNEAANRARGALYSTAAGSNPALARQAAYGGGQIGQDAERIKLQLQQMEQMQLGELQVGALGRRADYELAQQQMENQYLQALHEKEAQQWAMHAAQQGMHDAYQNKVISGFISTAASSMSDERSKNMIGGGEKTADEQLAALSAQLKAEDEKMMRQLQPQRYEYDAQAQAQGQPPGERLGVTAQQLERTPLGKSVVVNTPQGKMVDTGQATMQQYGLIGRLDERLRKLENYGPPASANPNRGGGDERMFNAVARERPQGAYDIGTSLVGAREDYIPGARPLTGDVRSEGARLRYGNEYLMPDGSIRRVPANFPASQGMIGRAAAQVGGARLQTVPAPTDEELFRVAQELAVRGY